jgi:type I restriction enzyme S subunit
MIKNYVLPKNWEMKSLGDIGTISMCKRIFKEQTQPHGDIPFYKIGTFGKVADAYISKKIYNEYKNNYPYPKKGDVLISASGTIGRAVVYNGEQAYYQDSNIVWIDNDEKQVLNKYLFYYYLMQPWKPTSGSIITRLYNDDIRQTDIPIPSIDEQKRIAKIIEIKLNAVEKAKVANDEQLSIIEKLFDSYVENIYKNENWDKLKLGDITIINPSTKGKIPDDNKMCVSFVPMTAVDAITGIIKNTECKKLSEVRKGYTYFENEDILFAKITPCMENGKSAIARNLQNGIGFGSTEFHVIKTTENILPEWVHYYIKRKKYLRDAKNYMTGSVGQQRLPDDYLYNTSIPLPPLEEQKKNVIMLKQKQEIINNICRSVAEQSAYINALSSSVLRKAFQGEL